MNFLISGYLRRCLFLVVKTGLPMTYLTAREQQRVPCPPPTSTMASLPLAMSTHGKSAATPGSDVGPTAPSLKKKKRGHQRLPALGYMLLPYASPNLMASSGSFVSHPSAPKKDTSVLYDS